MKIPKLNKSSQVSALQVAAREGLVEAREESRRAGQDRSARGRTSDRLAGLLGLQTFSKVMEGET